MRELPIPFSPPMARAILEGRKTQTRRLVEGVPPTPEPKVGPGNVQKHPAPYLDAYYDERRTEHNPRGMSRDWGWWQIDDRLHLPLFRLAYQPGDWLWVREPWRAHCEWDGVPPRDIPAYAPIQYIADKPLSPWLSRYRHARFMPRVFSRITLRVTDVRVERLRNISEADAIAEGADPLLVPPDGGSAPYTEGFEALWEGIHGPGSWTANPWVAAYTFERVTP